MSRAHDRSVRRLLHKFARCAAAAALACGTLTAGVVGMPTPAVEAAVPSLAVPQNTDDLAAVPTNPDVPDGQVGVLVEPANHGELAPGGKLEVTVNVVNRSREAIPAGRITLTLSDGPITTRYALEEWTQGQTSESISTERSLGEAPVGELAAGATARVELEVDATSLGLDVANGYAPYALRANLTAGAIQREGRSSIVWNPGTAASPNRVATIVPITAPLGRTPFLTAQELAAATVDGGDLDVVLDSVEGTKAALAIDPRVLASIRVLGKDAPPEAAAWLERLEALPNESFALPYADLDTELLADSGVTDFPTADLSLLADPEAFAPADGEQTLPATTGDTPNASPSGSPTTSTSPTEATPSVAGSPSLPSNEELRKVTATMDAIAWPAANSLGDGDLERLRNKGATTVLLDGSNVTLDEESPWTPSTAATIQGMDARVMDDALGRAVSRAVNAESDEAWSAAAAEMSTILAVTARELPQSPRTLLTATPRNVPTHPEYLGKTLKLLDELAWSDTVPFAETAPRANGQDPVTGSILPGDVDHVRVERVQQLMTALDKARGFATMYEDPKEFVADVEAALATSLASGWRRDRGEWLGVTQNVLNYVASCEHAVVVVPTSDIQLVGTEAALPVFVQNVGSRRVEVQVEFVPRSSLLKTGEPQIITIEPGSMTRAHLSVTAIGNGLTTGDVILKTPDGKQISTPHSLNVNVRAELEAVGIGIILAVIAVLLVAGTIRTIRRRRGGDADDAGDASDDTAAEHSDEGNNVADGADEPQDAEVADEAPHDEAAELSDEPSETER